MNKYEERGQRERRSSLRSSMTVWNAAAALVIVVLLILGLSNSAPSTFFTRAAIAAAVLLLVLRQVTRRLRGRASRAAQPDPQSTLKLH
jgi:Mg2+/citrate symporter